MINIVKNIDRETVEMVYKELTDEPVKLMISSNGGDVDSAFAIVDILMRHPWQVTTIGLGRIASAAFLIFLAGHERLVTPHTKFLHHAVTYCNGTIDTITELEEYQCWSDLFITERSLITQNDLDEVYRGNKDWTFGAQEALDMNVATNYY